MSTLRPLDDIWPFVARLTVLSSIPILERVEIPKELVPEDSRVELDAKIASGEANHAPPGQPPPSYWRGMNDTDDATPRLLYKRQQNDARGALRLARQIVDK